MTDLYLIPARGGSKGIPGKNIKELSGKPLIHYAIDVARELTDDENICISTDDTNIKEVAEDYGLTVPFIRPPELATDEAGSDGLILHALEYYENIGRAIDKIILLQPTSPFRNSKHVKEALEIYNNEIDMVCSVVETSSNPYYSLHEENDNGYLALSKTAGKVGRRQDVPTVFEVNGAIYIINVLSLKEFGSLRSFEKTKKYVMDRVHSVDIDDELDWQFCEFILERDYLSKG
ncbi:MAG: acylneuraminate cytidylyltransferase family protein [Bacteroidetes bacterium]|nr:acylneuraminate cytidylyltransferase family protein [Bacteroidota bacterium]